MSAVGICVHCPVREARKFFLVEKRNLNFKIKFALFTIGNKIKKSDFFYWPGIHPLIVAGPIKKRTFFAASLRKKHIICCCHFIGSARSGFSLNIQVPDVRFLIKKSKTNFNYLWSHFSKTTILGYSKKSVKNHSQDIKKKHLPRSKLPFCFFFILKSILGNSTVGNEGPVLYTTVGLESRLENGKRSRSRTTIF